MSSSAIKISVAMCTYNGEKYIAHQLQSILNQTVPVDEIIVCDDNSSDRTTSVIQEIQASSNVDIKLIVNQPNIGISANFTKAIGLCTGDIIFLSDQDDIWLPEKVATTMVWFESHPECEVVFSNGYFMDGNEASFTHRTMFEAAAFTPKAQKAFEMGFQLEAFLKNNRATGAAMAFRRRFVPCFTIEQTATIRNRKPLHDEMIALAAACKNQLGFITQPLIRYRVHTEQEAGYGSWIVKPPHTSDLIKPLVPSPDIIDFIPAEAKQRALFGIKRRQYRKIYHKWQVLIHKEEYQSHYGQYYYRPWLRDLFWLWV